MENSNK
jgi:hypothetical protein